MQKMNIKIVSRERERETARKQLKTVEDKISLRYICVQNKIKAYITVRSKIIIFTKFSQETNKTEHSSNPNSKLLYAPHICKLPTTIYYITIHKSHAEDEQNCNFPAPNVHQPTTTPKRTLFFTV